MKVCFISFEYPPKNIGGLGTYAEHLLKGLNDMGVDVCTITRGDQTTYNPKMYKLFIPDMPYWRRFYFTKRAIELANKLNKFWNFDLIHLNGPYPITGGLDLPTVCTFHSIHLNEIKMKFRTLKRIKTVKDITDLVLKDPVGSSFDIITARASDRIICVSPHLASLIRSYCLVDDQKVCVVPNGIDLEVFDKIEDPATSVLSNYNLEKDKYLLFIGRLSLLKGVQHLIGAFRTIKKEYPDLKLAIVGTGEYGDYLRNLAQGTDGIVFLGYVDAPKVKKALYENCVAVVLPSSYEGLPMVVLEAMACKKAVIASEVGGIPLIIKHGKNGFLAKPGDSRSLEKFIRILFENPDLRTKMGSFGRKLAEDNFTVDKMVNKTLIVYNSLI
jgi:glycogen(starch) synthase